MIEILPGIYYDPSKEWYEQDPALIDLALEVEKTEPISFELEESEIYPLHKRYKFSVWEHTTNMGTFRMRVDFDYLYEIDNGAFTGKFTHNKITLTQV